MKYCILILLIALTVACNNKKSAEKPEDTAPTKTDSLQLSDSVIIPVKNDSLAVFISGSIHLRNELLEGGRVFEPTHEEIEKFGTPENGIYSFLDFDIRYNPQVDSRLVSYTDVDEKDVRIFWVNYKDSVLSYVKKIGQLSGENPLEFGFDKDSRILKMEYYNIKTGQLYYKLENNGEFRLLNTPVLYNVEGRQIYRSDLASGTMVSFFNQRVPEDRDVNSFSAWFYPVKSTRKKDHHNSADTQDKMNPLFAIEGQKVLTLLPDNFIKVSFDEAKYGRLRQKFLSRMTDDPTAAFVEDKMSIYEINYGDNIYQIYAVGSLGSHDKYIWFFSTVNNDEDCTYLLFIASGSSVCGKVFTLDENLFVDLYTENSSSEGDTAKGGTVVSLNPEICFEAVTYWSND